MNGASLPPRQAVFRLLAALYTSQYLGVGFLFFGLVSILRQQGVDLTSLGLVGVIGSIWAVKFLWAPLIDRFGVRRLGHYRSWILILQPLVALATAALLLIREPEQQLDQIMIILAIYVTTSATQDMAVDALALRLVSARDRGPANGIATAGSWLGNILGGGAVVIVHDHFGWNAAVLTLTALTLLPLAFILGFTEPDRPERHTPLRTGYRALLGVFNQPGSRTWALLVMPLFQVGTTTVYGVLATALVDAGWSLTRIGIVLGMVIGVPAGLAALITGWCIARFGRMAGLIGAGLLCTVTAMPLLPLMLGRAPLASTTLALCGYTAAMAAANTLMYTLNMDCSRPGTAATDFTTLSAWATLWTFIAGAGFFALADTRGYPAVLGCGIGITLLGTLAGVLHLRQRAAHATANPASAEPDQQPTLTH
jgi:predicted MFS family arabinose efflux permease